MQDHLPPELRSLAQLRLSFLYRRRADYTRAFPLWQQLAATGAAPRARLIALEQLAIGYEHRLGDPAAAARVTRQALELGAGWRKRFEYRLQRLQRKLPTELLCASRSPAGAL